MTVSSPNVIESKLDGLIADVRFLRSQMIAFDRHLKGIDLSNQANRANNSPKANRDHGLWRLLARPQGQFCFCLQSGQQPAQPCFIWEHDPDNGTAICALMSTRRQAIFFRPRPQPTKPPPAKIRPEVM